MVKRKRVTDRAKSHQQDTVVRLFNFTFSNAHEYFLSVKKLEGLRKIAIDSYDEGLREEFETWDGNKTQCDFSKSIINIS